MKKEYKQAREDLRVWAVEYTDCDIQGDKQGWPCGTCFMFLLDKLGLKPENEAYHRHNKKIDRCNEVWRAILQIREAK